MLNDKKSDRLTTKLETLNIPHEAEALYKTHNDSLQQVEIYRQARLKKLLRKLAK